MCGVGHCGQHPQPRLQRQHRRREGVARWRRTSRLRAAVLPPTHSPTQWPTRPEEEPADGGAEGDAAAARRLSLLNGWKQGRHDQ